MRFLQRKSLGLLAVARLCLLCAVIGLLWSCDLNKTNSSRTEGATQLINGIKSYTTLREFMELHPQVKVESGSDGHPGDKWRPKYEIKQVTLLDYRHLEHLGKLTVTFFNDRLMSTTFYPHDVDRYLSELRKRGIEFKTDLAAFSVHTLIRVGTDYQGNRYVDWEDKGLAEEMGKWIKNNA